MIVNWPTIAVFTKGPKRVVFKGSPNLNPEILDEPEKRVIHMNPNTTRIFAG
ncbi:hypothetical protein HanXRQr2_Chr12g0535841 [Helianthus annuus]|uniref:Uncharacterized protein n=1 Tax=Helianthus annuus TaxID=4232 RepID=A0A9K3MVN1_HELAN|nr:hypothetical protein HanXRQr2_Chr12g0535841 [Helianthus annuus]KAJ0862267.1 hypothetical protein HanPSC8_Chr12g0516131 [Helianthus annuus]